MLPTLRPSDILTIQSADWRSVEPGDIVLVVRNEEMVIHRLLRIVALPGGSQLILRGDALPHNDPPAQASELLGKVCRIERKHRIIFPGREVPPVSRVLGKVLGGWGVFRNFALRALSTLPERLSLPEHLGRHDEGNRYTNANDATLRCDDCR